MKFAIVFVAVLALATAKSFNDLTVTVDPHEPQARTPGIEAWSDSSVVRAANVDELSANFWINNAYAKVLERVAEKENVNKAKNVIFFLGDGMSLNTITAARIRKGQLANRSGEEEVLFFEKFPYTGLSKTYCVDAQVADSACTATAYLTGVKTNYYMLGVTANVPSGNCTASMDPANHLSSIAQWAQAAGKSTGIITTTTLTHASPSGAYAHAAERFWEADTDIIAMSKGAIDPKDCMDIATQLITQEPGRNFDVMLGGGMGKFVPSTEVDAHGKVGERSDGVNLVDKWMQNNPGAAVATNRDELLGVNVNETTKLMGLFKSNVMDFHRMADPAEQPTLAEMTEVALKMLQKNEKGYFIFIEGGLIDYGNHYNYAGLSTDETLELEKAIKVAREMTSEEDTLIVLTADHAHPLTISGHPRRGNDILNLNEADKDVNGVKYTTLQYSVGLNTYQDSEGNRVDLTGQITSDLFQFPSYVKGSVGVHAGDDVGIFASGPFSHLFRGSLEQNTIPHMMAYAACIGDGPTMCEKYNVV